MPIIAAVQINGSSNIEKNLSATEHFVRAAAKAGAEFVATPEATTYLGPHDRKIQLAEPLDGPTHQRLARLAAALSIAAGQPAAAPRKQRNQHEDPDHGHAAHAASIWRRLC